jgi:hypothetical protein
MRSTKSSTLYLWASSEDERDMWRTLLAPYSWADGEFGMLCTNARFIECYDELRLRTDVPAAIVRQVKQYVAMLKRHRYGELCLNQGLVPQRSSY